MEVIKRKISLDEFTSKSKNNWGGLNTNGFKINLFFTQDVYDMGIFTNEVIKAKVTQSLPNYDILISKLNALHLNFNFMNNGTFTTDISGATLDTRHPKRRRTDYHIGGFMVKGLTDDRLESVQTYSELNQYITDFDMESGVYKNFKNQSIDGITRVLNRSDNDNPITYIINGNREETNFENPSDGILLKTYLDTIREVDNGVSSNEIPKTEFKFKSQGFNDTNTNLSPMFKEEYLFGITSSPEIKNDVFIDRGQNTILQHHLQLGDITNISELINYGNGFYNIIKK